MRKSNRTKGLAIYLLFTITTACGGGGGGSSSPPPVGAGPAPVTTTSLSTLNLNDNIATCLQSAYQVDSVEAFAALTELECGVYFATGVTSLEGLEAGKALQRISLQIAPGYSDPDTTPLDLAPLAELKELRELELYYGRPMGQDHPPLNLEPISALQNLTKLYLELPGIDSIGWLGTLSNLEEVGLGFREGDDNCINVYTQLESLEPLAHLPKLKLVAVCSNDLENASLMSTVTTFHLGSNSVRSISLSSNLTTLSLFGLATEAGTLPRMEPYDYSFLKSERHLKRLSLRATTFDDLSFLTEMEALEHLSISSAFCEDCQPLTDLSPLSGMLNLQSLAIYAAFPQYDPPAADLSSISHITTLTQLTVGEMGAIHLGQFEGHENLRQLALDTGGYTLAEVAAIPNLTSLELRSNSYFSGIRPNMGDLTPLSKLTGLENLLLQAREAASDISPLKDLAGLITLDLQNNAIEVLPDLSAWTNLRELNLSGNALQDLSPLSALPNLKYLNLASNGLTSATSLGNIGGLVGLNLWNNDLVEVDFVFSLPNLEGVNVMLNPNLDCERLAALRSEHPGFLSVTSDC